MMNGNNSSISVYATETTGPAVVRDLAYFADLVERLKAEREAEYRRVEEKHAQEREEREQRARAALFEVLPAELLNGFTVLPPEINPDPDGRICVRLQLNGALPLTVEAYPEPAYHDTLAGSAAARVKLHGPSGHRTPAGRPVFDSFLTFYADDPFAEREAKLAEFVVACAEKLRLTGLAAAGGGW